MQLVGVSTHFTIMQNFEDAGLSWERGGGMLDGTFTLRVQYLKTRV